MTIIGEKMIIIGEDLTKIRREIDNKLLAKKRCEIDNF